MDYSNSSLNEDPEFQGLPEEQKLQHYLTDILAQGLDDGTGLEFYTEELNTEGGVTSQTASRPGEPLVTGFSVHPNSAATEGLPSFAVRVYGAEAFRSRTGPDKPGRIWHMTVNWVLQQSETLEEVLFEFRNAHVGVTFTPDLDWTPGPGSEQWPRVRITSGSLPAIQSAIRAFALGEVLHDERVEHLEEGWCMNPRTGFVDIANFTWEVGHTRVGTEVFNAEEPPART